MELLWWVGFVGYALLGKSTPRGAVLLSRTGNKKRANAIKILARFLFLENEKLDGSLRLVSFNSGKMHNAIPRDGKIVFAVKNADKEQVRADWNIFASEVEDEFHVTEQAMLFFYFQWSRYCRRSPGKDQDSRDAADAPHDA